MCLCSIEQRFYARSRCGVAVIENKLPKDAVKTSKKCKTSLRHLLDFYVNDGGDNIILFVHVQRTNNMYLLYVKSYATTALQTLSLVNHFAIN